LGIGVEIEIPAKNNVFLINTASKLKESHDVIRLLYPLIGIVFPSACVEAVKVTYQISLVAVAN
jgi:hypothetical protein